MSSPPRKQLDDVSNAQAAPWQAVLGAGVGAPRPPPSCPPPPAANDGRIQTLLDAASAPAPPRHVLLQNCDDDDDDDDAAFGITSSATTLSTTPAAPRPSEPSSTRPRQGQGPGRDERRAQRRARVVPMDPARGYLKTSKFWGVSWHKGSQLWKANYLNKDNRLITIGGFATEEEATLAVTKAINEAEGIVGVPNTAGTVGELKKHERRTNGIDASGAPVPMPEAARNAIKHVAFDRSGVVPPDPARLAAGLTPSRFYHVTWHESHGRWQAAIKIRQGEGEKKKNVALGFHDTEEDAALAVNAALNALPPDVRAPIYDNPVDANGKLIPPPDRKSPHPTKDHKKRKAAESGKPKPLSSWSVDELKAFCRGRNLRVSGLKAELVQRIVDDAKTAAKPAKKKARRTETRILPPLPVREKVITWKLSGATVATTPMTVVRPAVPPVIAARAAVPPVVTPRAAVPPVVAAAVPPVVAAAGPPVVTPPAALPTAAPRPAPDADADGFHAAAGHLIACLDLAPLFRGGADANAAGPLFPPPAQYESV